MTADTSTATDYLKQLTAALPELDLSRVADWGARLAQLGSGGRRLLVAGNGGSAAQAQHLTAELVGRFQTERRPMSALSLHAETSSVTAISNDYGYEQVFARQVRAHARPGDVVLLMSGSGRSANLLRAAEAAREVGAVTWALTGPAPNPLATLVDEAVTVTAQALSTVQECHLVVIHLMCAAMDAAVAARHDTATDAVGSAPSAPPPSSASSPEPVGERRTAAARGDRPHLVVVGDAFLDRDHLGRVERVASDEPALVVTGGTTHVRPGGAALAAVLSARQGYPVTLVTALGQDTVGDQLRTLLGEARVEVVDLGLDGSTAVKTRIRAAGRTVMMLDEHDVCPPVGREGETALAAARRVLMAAGGVLVSDYGRGITAHPGLRAVLTEAARRSSLVWDPHPRGAVPVPHTAVVTPNSREARLIASSRAATRCPTTSKRPVRCGASGGRSRWRSPGTSMALSCSPTWICRRWSCPRQLPREERPTPAVRATSSPVTSPPCWPAASCPAKRWHRRWRQPRRTSRQVVPGPWTIRPTTAHP